LGGRFAGYRVSLGSRLLNQTANGRNSLSNFAIPTRMGKHLNFN